VNFYIKYARVIGFTFHDQLIRGFQINSNWLTKLLRSEIFRYRAW